MAIDVDWLETQLREAVNAERPSGAPQHPAKLDPPRLAATAIAEIVPTPILPTPNLPTHRPVSGKPTSDKHRQFGQDWDEQGFRAVLDSDDVDEQYRLLDRCRHRAYADDDLVWRGALTVLLARMGRFDEARRELEATGSRCRSTPLAPGVSSAIQSKLREAAAVLARPVDIGVS